MTAHALAIRYVAFAALATLANLAAQRLVFGAASGWSLLSSAVVYCLAVGIGTLVGLVLKYVLDKRWIFDDRSRGLQAHGKLFSLYVVMGIATTAIFWGTETLFWLIWHSQFARELGAVVGLSIGYFVKYRLDRRFVFRDAGDRDWRSRP